MTSQTGISAPNVNIPGYDVTQIPNMPPELMQWLSQLVNGAQGGSLQGLQHLQKLASGDQSTFEQIEAPAYEGFQKTLGQIGSRFSGFGGRNSSAFQNAVSGAGSELAQNLASQRQGIQNTAIDKLLNFSQGLLNQKPYDTIAQPEQKGGMDIGALVGQLLPQLLKLIATKGAA